ncbi:MAG: hypothetical protein AAGE01_07545 [Pseudomonadota bacterium]
MNWQPTNYQEQPSVRRRPGLSWRARLSGLVVVLVAIGWYLLGFLEAPEETGAPPLAPPTTDVSADRSRTGVIDRSAATTPAAVPGASIPASSRPQGGSQAREGEDARAIIERLGAVPSAEGLDSAHAEGRTLLEAGRTADAYLLFFYAARQGHAPSALALGTMADPGRATAEAGASAEPNLFEAHKWYKKASELGDRTAEARLADLRGRVEAAAAAGDAEAERLLLQWR